MGRDLGGQRGVAVGADQGRAARARRGRQAAGFAALPPPPLDRRRADAEEAAGLGDAEAGVGGPQQPRAEVSRVLLHPASMPFGPT
jgi:hypothetical protein